MTATQTKTTRTPRGPRFQAHVHPETYVETDPLDWRRPQLHTKKAECKLSACTWADYDEAEQARCVRLGKALKEELKASALVADAAPVDAVEDSPKVKLPKRSPRNPRRQDLKPNPAPAPDPAARPSKPNSERRNEMTHADGYSAVHSVGCSSCKARKGARCIRHDGEQTNHVHSARMKAWEAKGSPAVAKEAAK